MKKLIPLLLSLHVICVWGQQKMPYPDFERMIDSIVLSQKESFDVPGLAVGILRDHEVVYAKGFGVQGLDTQDPLTKQSLFHMASVSKPFVATAIMQLVEVGKLDLDERLVTYLPYFVMSDERYEAITIRQMLNHTSGIPDVEDYEWDNPQFDDEAAERYVKSFTHDQLDFAPGERYDYSNAAFDILADLIAKASGMTFEAYMKKHLFDPIGMVNSTFSKPEVPTELATHPHQMDDSLQMSVQIVYPYNRIHAPSSTLHSNVEDMLRWAQVNLNRGEINGTRIFSTSAYNMLTLPQVSTRGMDSVCLSWFSGYLGEYRMLQHSGGDKGYRSYFAFLPEANMAIVMMANNDFFSSGDAARFLLEKLLHANQNRTWKEPIHFLLKDEILTAGIAQCKTVYFQEKERNPDKYLFEGWCLDDLGYWLLDRGYHSQALDIFKFNVELEPEYPGWPDSVADAYRAMNHTESAIFWYKKALKLDPKQEFSRRKLKEISKQ